MTIQEAIEILDLFNRTGSHAVGEDLEDAMQLGIEALERIDHDRGLSPYSPFKRLPGETDE